MQRRETARPKRRPSTRQQRQGQTHTNRPAGSPSWQLQVKPPTVNERATEPSSASKMLDVHNTIHECLTVQCEPVDGRRPLAQPVKPMRPRTPATTSTLTTLGPRERP
ncbi:hypothetical protein G7046_g7840 [Stylonectria norvegica]|nr:hypothetical protein G7046_g7840 [Stylonectria norvegica]